MAVSPGTRAPDLAKRQYEVDYGRSLHEFTQDELLTSMTATEAVILDTAATAGVDILQAKVSDTARGCGRNTAEYTDDVEDFIASSTAIGGLIVAVRSARTHEAGERVRLLRSARARRWFSMHLE